MTASSPLDSRLQPIYARLLGELQETGPVLVAFSGGVDSTLLLYAASQALGDRVLAVTLAPPYVPAREIKDAANLAATMQVRHQILPMPLAEPIRNNPPKRCYTCKKILFSRLRDIARQEGLNHVIEGTNTDDLGDDRPGLQALQELGIRSPFVRTGLNKADIRNLSRAFELPTWNKPAFACLLTRIPFGVRVDLHELKRIEQAEEFLRDLGFPEVRVRTHGNLARIEVDQHRISELFKDGINFRINARLKTLGYEHVCMDMAGYHRGSMNKCQKQNKGDG